MSCPSSWLAVHPCRALVSQGHAAQPAVPLGPQTLPCTRTWLYRGVAVALRKWEWGGAHTLHPKGPCPTPPLPLPHATHPPTLGQQLYFPTTPPTNLPLPLPQPQLPLPSPARGQAVPPAYSLETPGVGWWAPAWVAAKHSFCSLQRPSWPCMQPLAIVSPSSGAPGLLATPPHFAALSLCVSRCPISPQNSPSLLKPPAPPQGS